MLEGNRVLLSKFCSQIFVRGAKKSVGIFDDEFPTIFGVM